MLSTGILFTADEHVAHLRETCPCGHLRSQHPGGDCRYCECPQFGLRAEAAGVFVAFVAWKRAGGTGPPPRLPARIDLAFVPAPNPCPRCAREAVARKRNS